MSPYRWAVGCGILLGIALSPWMKVNVEHDSTSLEPVPALAELTRCANQDSKDVWAKSTIREDYPTRGDWPQWRGAGRDGCSKETGLLQSWPTGGPPLAWTARKLGRGYSGPAVVGGRIYILGTDGPHSMAYALDVETGRTVWSAKIGNALENAWGDGPRSTPTVDGNRLYALTSKGNLVCLNCADGSSVWTVSLVDALGGEMPDWGYCESPLVDGERVIVTPGVDPAMVAFNKLTGKIIWKSSGLDDGAQYSSPVVVEHDGMRLYATMTDRGLVAVEADTGRLQFRYRKTNNGNAVCPTPIVHDGHIYTTSGYGTGCGLIKLARQGSQMMTEEVFFNGVMKNQHGGVVRVGRHVFGYSDLAGWVCQNFSTGEELWRENNALPKGSLAYADGRLYCLSEKDGTVALISATSSGWQEHGRLQLPESTRIDRQRGAVWTPPVIAQGRLLVRDQDLLFCYRLKGSLPVASTK